MSRWTVFYRVLGFAADRNITVEATSRTAAKAKVRREVKADFLSRYGREVRVTVTGTGTPSEAK